MTKAEAREELKELKKSLHSEAITYDQYIVRKRGLKRVFKAK